MITGILGVLFSIYFAVANVGIVLVIVFRYIGSFFGLVGFALTVFVGKYVGFLPASLSALIVSLLGILLLLKILGRE